MVEINVVNDPRTGMELNRIGYDTDIMILHHKKIMKFRGWDVFPGEEVKVNIVFRICNGIGLKFLFGF